MENFLEDFEKWQTKVEKYKFKCDELWRQRRDILLYNSVNKESKLNACEEKRQALAEEICHSDLDIIEITELLKILEIGRMENDKRNGDM